MKLLSQKCISFGHMRDIKNQLQPVLSIPLAIIYDTAICNIELEKNNIGIFAYRNAMWFNCVSFQNKSLEIFQINSFKVRLWCQTKLKHTFRPLSARRDRMTDFNHVSHIQLRV